MKNTLAFLFIALSVFGCSKKKAQKGAAPSTAPTQQGQSDQIFKNSFENRPAPVVTSDKILNLGQEKASDSSDASESNLDMEVTETIKHDLEARDSDPSNQFDDGPHFELISKINAVDLNVDDEIPELTISTYTQDIKFKFVPPTSNDEFAPDVNGVRPYKFEVCHETETLSNPKNILSPNIRGKACDYRAEVFLTREPSRKLTLALIKLRNFENPKAIGYVDIVFIRKMGKIIPLDDVLSPEQKDQISWTAKSFLNVTKEYPEVAGDFYYVLTKERANATRFKLIMSSDRYDLTTNVNINEFLNQSNVNKIPLEPPSNWNLGRWFKNKSYKGVREFNYLMESKHNPAELKKFKIELKLKSSENTPQTDIPVQFLLDFE